MTINIDESTNTKKNLTSQASKSSKKDPIKICINNFWQNAFDGDFFQHVLNLACDNNYEVVEDGNNADVVISSVFGNIRYPKDKTIFIIGENIRPNYRICKYSLSMDVDNYCGHNCYLPLWYSKIAWPGFKCKVEKTITSHNREGKLSRRRWVEVFSLKPAQFLGLDSSYGDLQVGQEIRGILFDLEAPDHLIQEKDFSSLSKNSCFIGSHLPGKLIKSFLGSKVISCE